MTSSFFDRLGDIPIASTVDPNDKLGPWPAQRPGRIREIKVDKSFSVMC
jgi:hypothetical protein